MSPGKLVNYRQQEVCGLDEEPVTSTQLDSPPGKIGSEKKEERFSAQDG